MKQIHVNKTEKNIDDLLIENKNTGNYQLHRSVFTDEELFELEMKYIFEGNWIYLAHESQIPNINDYYTLTMGRQPVVIARNKNGELNAFLNTCTHRGATLCRYKKGNKSSYTCPFHGWTFNNSGKLLKVKDPENAGYPDSFNCDGSHNLKHIAKFENYKGFLFGSLNADVKPLSEFLGEATNIIDMIVDQSDDGLEVLKGSSTYTFDGNWKLQAENGADGYHVTATHWNYAATTARRSEQESRKDGIKAMSASKWGQQGGGFYAFDHGHILLWTQWANPEDRPNFPRHEEFTEKFGKARADWMIERSRNLCLYPNVYLMDQFGSQIRLLRPISKDKTEVTIYCIAPKGEDAISRAKRIRQYEDFFNASGMATPDDLEEFRACQEGYYASNVEWNDMTRGSMHWVDGADEAAKSINMKPLMSGVKTEDEGLYVIQHQYWAKEMKKAIRSEVSK
jgi:benzoate/toluate 1,2-dioxygenase alpha subunit